jgi:hypothetical protein
MSQSSSLLIKTKICSNDNFELLDYNSLDIIMNKNNIDKSGILLRSENKVYFNENSDNVKDNETELLKIIKDTQNDCYYINTEDYKKDSNEILEKKGTFLVYRNSYIDEDKDEEKDNCKRFYKLSEGDIIKIGRVFIRILTINLDNKDTTEKTKNINNLSISKKNDINFTSLIRNSSYSSVIINGQEIIKGSCYNLGSVCSSNNINEEENNGELFLLCGNKLKNRKNIKKKLILPKVASSNDLLSSRGNEIRLKYKKSFTHLFSNGNENIQNSNKRITVNKNKKICRICFSEEENIDMENPLISPCLCKGSMKYIHYKCLKNWLESKIQASPFSSIELKDNIGMCYCENDLICELCKKKFPDYINYKGKLFNLTLYQTHFQKYLIFESQQIEDEKKFIHILSFDKSNKIIIGRSKECDISFPEISVSRYHCYIHYDKRKKNLYLEDNSSRFGTLILVQNPSLLMISKYKLKVQSNKTFIKIKLLVPFNLFSCCSIRYNMHKKYNSYQEQSEPYLDSSNFLEIKTNDNDNESEEEEDIKINGLNNINICEKDEKNKFFRKFTPLKLSNGNKNGNYFLLRLKSIDDIKNKRINKGNINKIIGKNSLNEQYTKLIETQRLLSANRNSVRSAEKDSSINLNLNGLNLNKKYIYIRNLNIFSLNTNKTNRKKIKFNRVHLFQKDKINNEDEDKKNL